MLSNIIKLLILVVLLSIKYPDIVVIPEVIPCTLKCLKKYDKSCYDGCFS